MGHAMNKVLKDFINRKEILKGKQVHYVPGWDCHGLPIELKVLQNMKSKEREGLTPIQLREKAAEFAKSTVDKQSVSFQRYGVIGDWQKPYLTLDPAFEAAQIGVFGEMFKKGYIFRGRKPVHWSPSSRTALAEAELEYPEGHVSKSIYVAFEVKEPSEALAEYHSEESPVKVAIWTTTPWTMPANLAVAVNPALSYSVVEHEKTGKLLVATDLAESLAVRSGCRGFYISRMCAYITVSYSFALPFTDNISASLTCPMESSLKCWQLLLEPSLLVPHIRIHFTNALRPCWPVEITLQQSRVQDWCTRLQVMVKRIT